MEHSKIEALEQRLARAESEVRRLKRWLLGTVIAAVVLILVGGFRSGTFEFETVRAKHVEADRTITSKTTISAKTLQARSLELVDERGNVRGTFTHKAWTGETCLKTTAGRGEATLCARPYEGTVLTLSDSQGKIVGRYP